MAEDTVVKEQLTNEMIEAGAELTKKLDEMGLHPQVAMWFFLAEINEWRLLFASPAVSTVGPQQVYEQIQQARKTLGRQAEHVPFSAIGLMDNNHQLVRLLHTANHTGPGVSRVRFSKNVIDGHFIDDALIYRNAA
jgi:hypothetical protein